MAKQVINTGAVANDNTGDPVRTAFTKTNSNFTELYNRLDIPTISGQAGRYLTNNGSVLSWAAVSGAGGGIELTDLSVSTATASGSGSLAYDNTSGVFTFTPPSISTWDGTTISDHLLPDTDVAYDLGSATNKFRDLYLSGSTINLGSETISLGVDGGVTFSSVNADAINVGGSIIQPDASGNLAIPGISSLRFKPDDIAVLTQGILNADAPVNNDWIVIDALTWLVANAVDPSNEPYYTIRSSGWVPSTYLPVFDGDDISGVTIDTATYYPEGAEYQTLEIVNSDLMLAIPPCDTTDFDAILAAGNSASAVLQCGVESLSETSFSAFPGASDQDLNTTDSPNFVNLGLAGTEGADATLSISTDKNFVIGLNDTTTGSKTFQFETDGSFLLEGSIYVDGNIYGGAGNRLYLSGDEGDGSPSVNLPNSINGGTTPIAIDNQFGGGVQIQTSTGNWLFDDTRFLHFPSSGTDDYNIGENVDGFNIRSDLSFGIATNFTTDAKYWTFGTDGTLTLPDVGNIVSTGHLNLDANYDGGHSVYIGNNHPTAGSLGGVVLGDVRGGFVDIKTTQFIISETSVPDHSTGSTGDILGQVAFDGSYIYYCTANYIGTPTTVSWSNFSEFDLGGGDHYVQADIADPSQLNGVLTITNVVENGVTSSELVTSYALISGNTYKFYLANTTEPWNTLQTSSLQVVPNIWKRVAWSNDTW